MPLVELNPNDFASVTWQRLRLYMESRLTVLRQRNDTLLPTEETAHLRGQISVLKSLLALETDPAKPAAGASPRP